MSVNKFKDTTVYGDFRNSDLLTSGSNNAIVKNCNATFDRNIAVGGSVVLASGASITANSSVISDVKLSYLSTLTSNVQTQFNNIISSAASTYQTIANMSNYLTTTVAASTYQPLTIMSDYLTTTVAAYTYQTIANMSNYLTTATAASTYQTIANMSSYLTTTVAASTYQTIENMSNYLTSFEVAATYAPLQSPELTDTPTAPTATAGTNNTQIATTAFVIQALISSFNNTLLLFFAGLYTNNVFTGVNTFSNDLYSIGKFFSKYISNDGVYVSPQLITYNSNILVVKNVTSSAVYTNTLATTLVNTSSLINTKVFTITVPSFYYNSNEVNFTIPISYSNTFSDSSSSSGSEFILTNNLFNSASSHILIYKNGSLDLWTSFTPNISSIDAVTTRFVTTNPISSFFSDGFLLSITGSFIPDYEGSVNVYTIYLSNYFETRANGGLSPTSFITNWYFNNPNITISNGASLTGTLTLPATGTGYAAINGNYLIPKVSDVSGDVFINNLNTNKSYSNILYTNYINSNNTNNTITVNNSLTLTGSPTCPTASTGTNTTQIASTAFVIANIKGLSYYARCTIKNTSSNFTVTNQSPTPGLILSCERLSGYSTGVLALRISPLIGTSNFNIQVNGAYNNSPAVYPMMFNVSGKSEEYAYSVLTSYVCYISCYYNNSLFDILTTGYIDVIIYV